MTLNYRISLWSGGKVARAWIVNEPPIVKDGVCQFAIEEESERQTVALMGTVSVEEGHWDKSPIRVERFHDSVESRL